MKKTNVLYLSGVSSIIIGIFVAYMMGYKCQDSYLNYEIASSEPGYYIDTNINIAEVIIISEDDESWYCYSKDKEKGDRITLLFDKFVDEDTELKIGQVLKIEYEFIVKISPQYFEHVTSVEVIGDADKDEFQEAIQYFNAKEK